MQEIFVGDECNYYCSLYTNTDIFLCELTGDTSDATDALDKIFLVN